MSQNSVVLPTSGTISGLQMTQDTNDALDTLNTLWLGASAPSSPEAGQLWHDTTANILRLRSLDNTSWIALFSFNESAYTAAPANNYQITTPMLASSVLTSGWRNLFRNGTFDWAQRGTSGTVSTGSTQYALDGWYVSATGTTLNWSQAANTSSFGQGGAYNELLLTGATGMSDAFVRQRIESVLAANCISQPVTVQFWIYNGSGAAVVPTLTVRHANSRDNWSSATTDVSSVSLQSCANGSATQCAYTFTGSSSSGNGLEITLDFGASLNAGSKTIAILAADIRVTPGVTGGLNNNPPFAELRFGAMEADLNMRYFESSYDNGVAPGTANAFGNEETAQSPTTNVTINVRFKAPKRTAPTMTVYSPNSGTSGKFYDATGTADVTASVANFSTNGGQIYSASVTSLHQFQAQWTATAEL